MLCGLVLRFGTSRGGSGAPLGFAYGLGMLMLVGVGEAGGAFEFVPVEAAAVNSALQRLEQHHAEELAIGKALQPDIPEQPDVFAMVGVAPLQRECNG